MTQTVHLTTKTAYYYGETELWTQQRIAAEYGVSKSAVRAWSRLEDFPAPFAITPNENVSKAFYRADEIRIWAETTKRPERATQTVRQGRPRTVEHDPRLEVEVILAS